ncbi:hypothetical protein LSH36_32g11004 [Paralvinella palmiformis]|uniref:Uncharacterized protein n=1 Tax=Paralvinella palmiformis TaxID=53620 RepID=A0AAD9K9A6_9ANNE|nr:hypothetical protein LSH36_32g11004 [Paralvinella palmiformis]
MILHLTHLGVLFPEMPTDVHVMSIDEENVDESFEDFVKPISNVPPEEGATDEQEEWTIFESVDPDVDYDDPVDPTPESGDPHPGEDDPPDPEDLGDDYTFFEPKKPPDFYNSDDYT